MRGTMADLATAELGLRCRSQLLTVGWYAKVPLLNQSLHLAFSGAPKPHVCYFIKEAWGPEPDVCHHVGAFTVFDVIDSDKRSGVFPGAHVFKAQLLAIKPNIDLHLVNTEYHATYLRSVGVSAVAFPHPHGKCAARIRTGCRFKSNCTQQSVCEYLCDSFHVFREKLPKVNFSQIGLMAGQLANMPDNTTLLWLANQACYAGMQLTLIASEPRGPRKLKCPSKSCPDLSCDKHLLGALWRPPAASSSFGARTVKRGTLTAPDECTRFALGPLTREIDPKHDRQRDTAHLASLLRDNPKVKDQQRYYDWGRAMPPALAIIWEPSSIKPGTPLHFFASNRPQTRQAWWWSFGVPTIGSAQVKSSQEMGDRVGMRTLNSIAWLTDVRSALSCIQTTPGMYATMRGRVLNESRHSTSLESMRKLQDIVHAMHRRSGGVVPQSTGEYLQSNGRY